MRRLKYILLLVVSLLCNLAANAEKVGINGVWYNLISKAKQAEVTFRGDYYSSYNNEYSGSVTIPSIIVHNGEEYKVTSIGEGAFRECSGLTAISLPEGITSIGGSAFCDCSALASIVIPESVKSIGDAAFGRCSKLASIFLSEGLTSIGESAFYGCSTLTSIIIPEGVTSIGFWTFRYCSSLASIVIPASVTSIGDEAFSECSSLASLYISSIDAWCNISFLGYLSNPLIYTHKFYLDGELVTDLIIPEGVNSIGNSAFLSCTSLTSISIPKSATQIGNSAFTGCSSITSITIPENSQLTSIGESAFSNCSSLVTITIPESVTSIGKSAFYGCKGFTSITIPESVTRLGEKAFSNCSCLKSVILSKGLKSIEAKAFANCDELEEVYCYAESVPSTEANVFEGSYIEYSTLYVPNSAVENYKVRAPWSDFAAIYPIDEGSDDSVDTGLFLDWISDNQGQSGSNSSKTYTFVATQGSVLSFDWQVSSESGWDWFIATLNDVEILKKSGESSGSYQYTFTSSGNNTLEVKYTKDGSVDGGADYAKVYNIALSTTPSIASGTCGDNLTWKLTEEYELVIEGTGAMYDYEERETPWNEYRDTINAITLPEGMTSIGDRAFRECTSFTSITIPESVTSIGMEAFWGCDSLASLTIPEGVTSIGERTFCFCNLIRINIPASVTSIGSAAFANNPNLSEIVVEQGNAYYDSRHNCNAIIEKANGLLVAGCASTLIPEGVATIGRAAFSSAGLSSIAIPKSVTSINY